MKRFAVVLILGFISVMTHAQDATTLRKNQFNLADGNIGIKGYDPVVYFKENKARKGTKDLAVYYQGVTYYFASAANKEEFKANAAKYEPQYGGWCAYAMGAKGEKVSIDPETFKIVDGKLYLFYNRLFNNTLTSWNKDEPTLKSKADINWKKFFH